MNISLCTKILNAEQIRAADQDTIENEPIASIDLMERAAQCFTEHILNNYPHDKPVVVLCGTGNNGGDGLAITRMLQNMHVAAKAFVIGDLEKGSADFIINFERLKNVHKPILIQSHADFPNLTKETIVIDALFGSGLSRGIGGLIGDLIDYVNSSVCQRRIAVDIASGLGCEKVFEGGKILEVSETYTFQVPKLSQLLPQNGLFTGNITVLDIGLSQAFIDQQSTNYYQFNKAFIQSIYKKRGKYLHKGGAGHVLLISGSLGKMGAAVLSARACMRAGAGLLTIGIPACGIQIMQTAVPEAMVALDLGHDYIKEIPDLTQFDAIGIGPGLGQLLPTMAALDTLLEEAQVPLVIDADALNILGANRDLLSHIPRNSVLTPHPGEFRRLVGDWKDDYERLELQRKFAIKYQVVVVLKGANTSIASLKGQIFFNTTGNPGMATAGSGDVLTGIITSLIGQGYASLEAAILGVYLHGLSGDLIAEQNGQESLIASDLVEGLGKAFQNVYKNL